MPPEMMTIVAPTPMMAKALASVAIWMSVCALRKLLTRPPVTGSVCDPAASVRTMPSATSTRHEADLLRAKQRSAGAAKGRRPA